jgi:hypothetical protein
MKTQNPRNKFQEKANFDLVRNKVIKEIGEIGEIKEYGNKGNKGNK